MYSPDLYFYGNVELREIVWVLFELGKLNCGMVTNVKSNESASRAVKRLIAQSEDCRPSQLGTLKAVVDVNELAEKIESSPSDQETCTRPLIFQYCGYSVEVRSDRTISIDS